MADITVTREQIHWMHADAIARIGREVRDLTWAHIYVDQTDPTTGEIDGGDLHLMVAGVLGVLLDDALRYVRPEDERAWIAGVFQYAPRTVALFQRLCLESAQ